MKIITDSQVEGGMSEDFTITGFTIPKIAIYCGAFLTLWGIAAYFISDQSSVTAMIPSFMGAPLMILGILSERMPNMRHHLMHAAMVLALVMVLGGARVFTQMSEMSDLAISSHLFLIVVGVSFMACGIMSFRAARLAREGE